MKVILQQDVKGQGKKGQTVEVSDGYARNFLFPKKLAVPATTDNMNAMRIKENARLAQIEREKEAAKETAKKLEGIKVTIKAKSGNGGKLFGAVTSKEISDALAAQFGITVEKNKIVQSDPIKNYGTYEVKCKLGHEVSGKFTVYVTEA
ncbi:MAG: 50S ribosomal protein L9 [Oscillospiraceae bacterium]|nr:50S ribosomal protein L9 [Oscillospiraceae bacterium]MBQ9857747.1 50S ribosomal protein L9 [Oscillospiraceae bacterium]